MECEDDNTDKHTQMAAHCLELHRGAIPDYKRAGGFHCPSTWAVEQLSLSASMNSEYSVSYAIAKKLLKAKTPNKADFNISFDVI